MKMYNSIDDLSKIFERSQLGDKVLIARVQDIVNNVRDGKDSALFDCCSKFDNYAPTSDTICIQKAELKQYESALSSQLHSAILGAIANVKEYHERQMSKYQDVFYTKNTSTLGWMYKALKRVGIYVPGGKAIYPSSVIMCALPAIVAGVQQVVVATPNPNPITLAAASLCGVDAVYRMGGAHGIAALAYGTESVQKVDLIAGPGNIYVTLAKKAVYGHVGIDMIAGPSEILVIADDSAVPEYVAADLLSQAEHDEMAASILITDSCEMARKVNEQIAIQIENLERKDIISKSLQNNGAIIIVDKIDDALKISDKIAPEHLEICAKNAEQLALKVNNAGAVFVGNYSPEPLGDYYAGASHCLPTSGSARYFNVLSVDTFMKKMSYINYSQQDLLAAADNIITLGEAEGFTAHANTIKERVKMEGKL